MHEELVHGTLSEVIAELTARASIAGEVTVVLAAAIAEEGKLPSPAELRAELERLRGEGMRRNDALKALAETWKVGKNDLYRLLVDEGGEEPPGE
jgi:16S rRNA (cytidine1402-2'-O)-methyltransferase